MFYADAHNDLPWGLFTNKDCLGTEQFFDIGGRLQVYSLFSHPEMINLFVDSLCQARLLQKEMEHTGLHCCPYDGSAELNETILYYLLMLEGAENIGQSLDNLRLFYELNVRVVGLTWNRENGYCSNAASIFDDGLSRKGRELIRHMNDWGMAVDLSHASRNSFIEACEYSLEPCMASHSNCAEICGHKRNIDQEQLQMLIDSDGYLGLCFYEPFIGGGIETLFAHVDYCFEKGAENIVGFGSDINGMEASSLNSYDVFGQLTSRMQAAGYHQDAIEKFANRNLLRFLSKFTHKNRIRL